MATLKLELNRDDLLSDSTYTSPSFAETVVGGGWKVVFNDSGSPVANGTVNFSVALEDAYALIRSNLVGSPADVPFRLTSARIAALTDALPGIVLYDTTNDDIVCRNSTEFVVLGATAWQLRSTATVQTTDATQTTIDSFTLDDEETYMVQINVVGTKSDGSDRAGAIKSALLYRDGGGATIEGVVASTLDENSDSNWAIDITVSGNDVRASVTGLAATTVNWKCSMQFIEQ